MSKTIKQKKQKLKNINKCKTSFKNKYLLLCGLLKIPDTQQNIKLKASIR